MRLARYELIVNANVCNLVGATVLDGSGRFFVGTKSNVPKRKQHFSCRCVCELARRSSFRSFVALILAESIVSPYLHIADIRYFDHDLFLCERRMAQTPNHDVPVESPLYFHRPR